METEEKPEVYEFGDYRVESAKRLLVRNDGRVIPLNAKVFDTLLLLLRKPGSLLEKDELMAAIWPDTIVEENNLNKNISKLRKALGESLGENKYIATVPGKGYQFVAEVTVVKADDETRLARPVETLRRRNRVVLPAIAGIVILLAISYEFYRSEGIGGEPSTIGSLAIVPFKPLVPEHRNESLEFGMADALISRMSGREELSVRPLSSVRRFASLETDAVLTGKALNVDAVLDGTIQTWGDRIRVSAKLTRTLDGKILWQGQFDELSSDIFSVQDRIARQVAAELHATLSNVSRTRYTANIQAYRLYTLGRFHTLKLAPPEIKRGIDYFKQALETDPNYALAYAGLADAYRTLAMIGGVREHFSDAKTAAEKAVEIDPSLAEGHAILGFSLFWDDWDWGGAEKEITIALRHDPNSADAHFALAHLLSNLGRHNEALAHSERASELDPLNIRTVGLRSMFLLNAGRAEESLSNALKARELDPNFWGTYVAESLAHLQTGKIDEALRAIKTARERSGGNSLTIGTEGFILARAGNLDEARSRLAELLETHPNPAQRICPTALLYHALGDPPNSFATLDQGYELRDPCMTFLKVDPRWEGLRSEPRFIDLLRRMNF